MSHKAVTLRYNYWGNVEAIAFSKSGARGKEAVSIQGQKYGKVSTDTAINGIIAQKCL